MTIKNTDNDNEKMKIPYVLIFLLFVSYYLYAKDYIVNEFSEILSQNSNVTSTVYLVFILVISYSISIKYKSKIIYNSVIRSYLRISGLLLLVSLFSLLFLNVSSRDFYIGYLCLITIFITFYLIALDEHLFRVIKFILLLWVIALLYEYFKTYQSTGIFVSYTNSMNSSYVFLVLFPLIMFFSSTKQRVVFSFVILACLILSNKRGGAVAAAIGMPIFFVIDNVRYLKRIGKRKVLYLMVFSLIVICLWQLAEEFISSENIILIERFQELENDQGSGRAEIWSSIFNKLVNSNLFEIVFGHGHDSTRLYTSNHHTAHNDYLEILFDYGLIVFLSYLSFIVVMIRHTLRLIKRKSKVASYFTSSLAIFIILSFVTHIIIYPLYMLLFSMTWGYLLGIEQSLELKKNNWVQ